MCAALDPEFRLAETPAGFRQVVERPSDLRRLERASQVCPFADSPDETAMAKRLFPAARYQDDAIGRYEAIYAGWSAKHRALAGSGGLTRWLLARLLETGAIDFVVTVDSKAFGDAGDLFTSAIHTTAGSYLENCSASAYFPVEFDSVIARLRQTPGRFAVTALPCFARGLRVLADQDAEIGSRLVMISGVICGGLKGRRYADYLAHQMGVAPRKVNRINFRGKTLSQTAHEQCVEIWANGNDGDKPDGVRRVQELKATDYGAGYFKPKACDYCDDVYAEVADIAFGDAWISPYRHNPDGTNIVVVRNKAIDRVLRDAAAEGEIDLEQLTAAQARQSQLSSLRHRRSGLGGVDKLVDARLGG